MRDADVRTALLKSLAEQHAGDSETYVVQEMGVWSGTVRIDVAVINGQLNGYELKSAKDTLERLDAQAELYNQVFDHVTLVTAERHYLKAYKKIPKWWGITIAVPQKDGTVTLRLSRSAKPNRNVVPLQVARLLWRSEALELLERYGLDRGIRGGTIEALATRLAERLPLATLQDDVRSILKARAARLRQSVSYELQMTVCGNLDPDWSTP